MKFRGFRFYKVRKAKSGINKKRGFKSGHDNCVIC